jgi:hypothetical protein
LIFFTWAFSNYYRNLLHSSIIIHTISPVIYPKLYTNLDHILQDFFIQFNSSNFERFRIDFIEISSGFSNDVPVISFRLLLESLYLVIGPFLQVRQRSLLGSLLDLLYVVIGPFLQIRWWFLLGSLLDRARRVQVFLDPDPTRTRSNNFFGDPDSVQ